MVGLELTSGVAANAKGKRAATVGILGVALLLSACVSYEPTCTEGRALDKVLESYVRKPDKDPAAIRAGHVVVGRESKSIEQYLQALFDQEPRHDYLDGSFSDGSRLHALNLVCRVGEAESSEYRCWYHYQSQRGAQIGITAGANRSVWVFEFIFTFGRTVRKVALSSARYLGGSVMDVRSC